MMKGKKVQRSGELKFLALAFFVSHHVISPTARRPVVTCPGGCYLGIMEIYLSRILLLGASILYSKDAGSILILGCRGLQIDIASRVGRQRKRELFCPAMPS